MKAQQVITLVESLNGLEMFADIKAYFIKKFKQAGCQISDVSYFGFPFIQIPCYLENLQYNTTDDNYDICYKYLLDLKASLKHPSLFSSIKQETTLLINCADIPKELILLLKSKPLFQINVHPVFNKDKITIHAVIFFDADTIDMFKNIEKITDIQVSQFNTPPDFNIIELLKDEIKKRIDIISKAIRLTPFRDLKE